MTPTQRCPPCPHCNHAVGVHVTVKSDFGWYCLCDNCGHFWHQTIAREPASWLDAAVVAEKPDEH